MAVGVKLRAALAISYGFYRITETVWFTGSRTRGRKATASVKHDRNQLSAGTKYSIVQCWASSSDAEPSTRERALIQHRVASSTDNHAVSLQSAALTRTSGWSGDAMGRAEGFSLRTKKSLKVLNDSTGSAASLMSTSPANSFRKPGMFCARTSA